MNFLNWCIFFWGRHADRHGVEEMKADCQKKTGRAKRRWAERRESEERERARESEERREMGKRENVVW